MRYCQKCGKIYDDSIKLCPSCQIELARIQSSCLNSNLSYETYPTVALKTLVLSVLFPWMGILLYAMYRSSQPDNANRIMKALLIYLFIMLLLGILMVKAIW